MKKNKKILVIIFVLALLFDQITKIIAYINGWNVLTGAEKESNISNILLTIIITILILRYISNENTFIKQDTRIILILAVSGAIGNLIDRIWNKNIITFIQIGNSISLNLAYVYILISWIGFAIILAKNTVKILNERKKGTKNEYKKNNSK